MINCCFWWQDGSCVDDTLLVTLCNDALFENLLFMYLHVLLTLDFFCILEVYVDVEDKISTAKDEVWY